MVKRYVGPENPPSGKKKKDKTKEKELEQIEIEKETLADEKQKLAGEKEEFKKQKDNFKQELSKGDETMEPKELEKEVRDLKGDLGKLTTSVGEMAGIEKERQRQEADRKSKEEEDKRLKSIVDPVQAGLKDVKETVKGVKDDFEKFCAMNPEDPRCKNFTDQVSQRIKETLKPKEEESKKKEEELKAPESKIVPGEEKKLFGELADMRTYYKGLTGEEAKRPVTIVAGVAREALKKIAESDPKAVSEIVENFIPEKIVEEIKKGLTDINSIKPEDKAKLFVQECQGPNAPAFCKILKEGGFNIQEKKKGSMPGSSGWKDVT